MSLALDGAGRCRGQRMDDGWVWDLVWLDGREMYDGGV
jgi:hypothetical protein